MFYQIVTINGRDIIFEADEVESDTFTHVFKVDGEISAEFERKNIAGYIAFEQEEDEDA